MLFIVLRNLFIFQYEYVIVLAYDLHCYNHLKNLYKCKLYTQ